MKDGEPKKANHADGGENVHGEHHSCCWAMVQGGFSRIESSFNRLHLMLDGLLLIDLM